MFKIIGSMAVIASLGLWGTGRYNELRERKRILEEVCDGSRKISDNLRCMCLPLYECFLRGGIFFGKAAGFIENGLLPGDAVKKAAKEFRLSGDAYNAVCRFSEGLMAADCEGQIRNVEFFITELEKSIIKTENELETKGKLFVKGSLLVAASIVLLLL